MLLLRRAALRVSGAVETASSEERPQDHLMGGQGYAVSWRTCAGCGGTAGTPVATALLIKQPGMGTGGTGTLAATRLLVGRHAPLVPAASRPHSNPHAP